MKGSYLKRTPLPLLVAIVGVIGGIAVWLVLDRIQGALLTDLVDAEQAERLEREADAGLTRFNTFIDRYRALADLLAERAGSAPAGDPWRGLVAPEFEVLLDRGGERVTRLPERFPAAVEAGLRALVARDGGDHLAVIGGVPRLVLVRRATAQRPDRFLALVVRIDAALLRASQAGALTPDAVVALTDYQSRVLASSDPHLLRPGGPLRAPGDGLIGAARPIETVGAADPPTSLAILLPRGSSAQAGQRVVALARRHGVITATALVIAFTLLMVALSAQLTQALSRIATLARRSLGIDQPVVAGGNPLSALRDWLEQFVHLVRRARDEMRREHESRMRESEALKTAVLETAPDSIVTVDDQGIIIELNQTAQRVLGRSRTRTLGRLFPELILAPESRSEFLRLLQRCGSECEIGCSVRCDRMRAVRADGTPFEVETAITPTQLKRRMLFIVYLKDISQRRAAERQVAALARFASESPSPVLRVNPRGVITYANQASGPLLDYWGCGRGQTLPLYWKSLITQILRSGHNREIEISHQGRIFSLLMAPMREPDHINIYARETTEVRLAEQKSRQHQSELVHVCRLSTMGEMATGIAHELNQPLSAIVNYARGCTRRIQSGVGGQKDLLDPLDQITVQARRAGEIIRRMRALVKKEPAVRSIVDLNDLAREVRSFVEFEARKLNVEIELDLYPFAAEVWADLVQIEQVVLNLVRNALDALKTVPEEMRSVTISTRIDPQGIVRLIVHDTGVGIPDETLVHLFDAFYTTKGGGMGMGLAISKTIIDDHGGNIGVRSALGYGSEFTIELPAASGERLLQKDQGDEWRTDRIRSG